MLAGLAGASAAAGAGDGRGGSDDAGLAALAGASAAQTGCDETAERAGRSPSRREELENMPMTIHRMGEDAGGRGCCCGRQLERLMECMGCAGSAAQAASPPGQAARIVPGMENLIGLATPAAAIAPAEWRCPMTGQMCPFSARAAEETAGAAD